MKKIFVRKTLRYDPTCGGKYSRYQGYCLITQGVLDPEIIPGQKLINRLNYEKVFCSPALRARESVDCTYENVSELFEVNFNLRKVVSESEYIKFGSCLVSKRFLGMFIRDDLGERRSEIKKRIDKLINIIRRLPEEKCLLVSHSFFMKIFESYLNNKNLFENPEKLSDYLNPQNRTYNFGEGFEFEI